MTPLEVFTTYLAVKNHFTKTNYDFHKYHGKVKTSLKTFYNKKERFFYEKLSRQKTDKEIVDFFVCNFVECNDPHALWIGEIVKEGDERYQKWYTKKQNLVDVFVNEINSSFKDKNFDEMFSIKSNRHPQLLKEYLQEKLSIETLVILDQILEYKKQFDSKLYDPIWDSVSLKISKYSPFLVVNTNKYKKILKECIL